MSNQPTLDLFPRPEAKGKPAGDPAFWIEEVRLLKSFSPEKDEQIREPITFQKGLNIVWAKAPPMKKRKKVNFAGHAAGKTTLCRLLRYLLGEHHTAAPGVKEAIEDTFYNGWIAGKIHIGAQTWIVARPLHHLTRPRARCLRSDSFEELLSNPAASLPVEEFERELTEATVVPLQVKLFGDGETGITFAHVLQWLTRDQDCHLTKLHFFRHPDSKSKSPDISAESAFFLQRIMLDLADEKLQKAITACEKLEKEAKKLPSDKEYQQRREKELNEFLETAGIKTKDTPLLSEIQIESTRKSVSEQEEEKTRILRDAIQLAKNTRTKLKADLPALQESLGVVKTNILTAKSAVQEAQDTVDALNGKEFDWEAEKEKAKKRPPSAYCRVPRQIAGTCKTFCEWDVLSENEEQKDALIARQKEAAGKNLGICITNLSNFEAEQKRIEDRIKSINEEAGSIDTNIKSLEEKLEQLKSPYALIRTKLTDLEEVIAKLASLKESESELEGKVEKAKELQERRQLQYKGTQDEFGDEYAWTVSQVFGGDNSEAACKFTREKITTNVTYNGKDLTSAAVMALQTLCFDIAAMTFSCRGRGFHPRFLLHDSPREADMGEAPYGRLFDRIAEQAAENPNFQHIITTTTTPPDEYRALPCLRLELDSTEPEGRLFRRNL